MLTLRAHGGRLCDGLSRRTMLQAGSLGAVGLSLPHWAQSLAVASQSSTRTGAGRAKACIVLFLMGGAPQHSTFDPKPDAPEEVRGAFGPVATSVPGTQFCELLPNLTRQADRLAVIRSVSTRDNAHSSSGYYVLTGRPHVPQNVENANPGAPNDFPNLGAVVQKLRPHVSDLPTAVRLPNRIFNTDGSVWPGQDAGWLGKTADPWLFNCEPATKGFKVEEVSLPVDIPFDRLERRGSLLRDVNLAFDSARESGMLGKYSLAAQRAFNVLASEKSRRAFDLETEPVERRMAYGMSQFGQSALLARRLVEAGVGLVQVNWFRGPDEPTDNPCWDSHTKESHRLKDVLCPAFDQGMAALLDDLAERGMLDETLVCCLTEFGRTPRFNSRGGRDHWGSVFSVALAGGGIKGGTVYGSSDAHGGFPAAGLCRPEDISATIFHCLGIAPETEIHDPQGRPFVISPGQILHEIVA
jgi:uncharacterized protein (DUF1501 family)